MAEMSAPVVLADLDGWTHGYGLGLQLWRSGERVYIGHTGSMPGYLAVLVVHRRSGTGVVAFANTYSLPGTGIGKLGISVLDAVLDGEPAPARAVAARSRRRRTTSRRCAAGGGGWAGSSRPRWDGRAGAPWHRARAPSRGGSPPRGPTAGAGRPASRPARSSPCSATRTATVAGLDIATFVFRREPMAD